MIPRKGTPQAYPEQAPGGWTVERIRSAITSLEEGYLTPAARLTRALPRHPRYVQGREQFIGAVMGCPQEVLQAPIAYGGKGLARRLQEGCGPMLARALSDAAERWLIEWSRVMPLAVGVLGWDTTSRPWAPIPLTRWPLEAVRVDLHRRELWACVAGGREELITPGDGTWVVVWADGAFNMSAGLIRCFGEAWIRGINAGRDVANRSRADSVSAVVQPVPEGTTNMQATEVVDYEDDLKNLQKGGIAGIMTPPGWPAPTPLDLATKNAAATLELALERSDDDLLVPWLMQDGTAKNEGGSLAKAKELSGVLYAAVQSCVGSIWGQATADGSHVPGAISSQIVRPWAMYQLPSGGEVEEGSEVAPRGDVTPLAIRRVPDLEEDDRLKAQSSRAQAFWTEVGSIEGVMRRDMTEDELGQLAKVRGVVVPEGVLKDRGKKVAPATGEGGGFGKDVS